MYCLLPKPIDASARNEWKWLNPHIPTHGSSLIEILLLLFGVYPLWTAPHLCWAQIVAMNTFLFLIPKAEMSLGTVTVKTIIYDFLATNNELSNLIWSFHASKSCCDVQSSLVLVSVWEPKRSALVTACWDVVMILKLSHPFNACPKCGLDSFSIGIVI